MRSVLARARGLARRYAADRRLPPQVLSLLVDIVRLRLTAARSVLFVRMRPVVRSGVDGRSVRSSGRRLIAHAPTAEPLADLAHRHAGAVVGALSAASIDTFVVARDGDALVLGLDLADRTAALDALRARLGTGWYLDWRDGRRAGTVALSARSHSSVRRAREWRLYQAAAWGDLAVGPAQGAVITFWAPGTSDQLELVGTRGQARFDTRSPTTEEVIDGRRYPGRTAFPMTNLETITEPVDVVYTWVNGGDPAWQQSFRQTAARFGRSIDETALDPARYTSRDELRYSLRSVWAFCGWVNQIYVVTAGQRPDWLLDDPRVRIVDHSEILPADALPTFNSHAIEAALHRIPGLSEHFIYFNDDMLIGRPVRPETFFTSNGLARVFQSDARVVGFEDERTLAVDTAALRGRELLRQHFGKVVSHKPLHSPYPLRRSVIDEIDREFPEKMESTRHSRFRSPADLSVAASFAQHYALATQRAVLGDIASEYVHIESGRLRWHLDRIRLGRWFDTFCINETEHRGGHGEREAMIRAFFDEYFPVAAPWERA